MTRRAGANSSSTRTPASSRCPDATPRPSTTRPFSRQPRRLVRRPLQSTTQPLRPTTGVSAVSRILVALEAEGASTFDANGYIQSAYNFSSSLDVVINGGVGPPQKATGMVGTSFRPSDDKVAFRFNIPDVSIFTGRAGEKEV